MTGALRFRYRHVHATLYHYVRDGLVTLGWGDAALDESDPDNDPINFDGTPITYIDFQPEEMGETIVVNTVAVTLGDEPASDDQELGGGLQQLAIPVFVDVYGANQSIAQSIASDVKDLFEDVYMQVKDFSATSLDEDNNPVSDPQDTNDQLELDKDDLMVEKPQIALAAVDVRRHWRVVKTFARINYVNGNEL